MELRDVIAIDPHIGLIRERQASYYAGLLRNYAVTQFVFEILRVNLPRPPHQVDAIGDFGHQRLGKAKTPIAVFVVDAEADGVTAGVGGVVVSAAIVDGPVGELQMETGAD